jgi:hypothetical protein
VLGAEREREDEETREAAAAAEKIHMTEEIKNDKKIILCSNHSGGDKTGRERGAHFPQW